MSRAWIRQAAAGVLVSALLVGVAGGQVRAEGPYYGEPVPPYPVREKAPQPKVTREQALQIAKQIKYLTLPADANLRVRLNTWGQPLMWEISASGADGFGDYYGEPVASIDAMTGQVRAFAEIQPRRAVLPTGPRKPEADAAELRRLAERIFTEFVPQAERQSLVFQEQADLALSGMGKAMRNEQTFDWVEQRNGALIPFSQVNIVIDTAALQVRSFYNGIRVGANYPVMPVKVTPEAAAERFRALEPRLVYAPVHDFRLGAEEPVAQALQYWFPGAQVTLDATTGAWEHPVTEVLGMEATEALPPGSGEVIRASSLPLTEAEAVRIANTLVQLPEGTEFDSSPGKAMGYLYLSWNTETEGGNLIFDQKTGRLQSAWRFRNGGYKSMKDLEDEARARRQPEAGQVAKARAEAIRLVQTYFGALPGLRLMSPAAVGVPEGEAANTFRFQRYHDGIPVLSDSVEITLDPATLQWQNIRSNWADGVTLPPAVGLVTPAQAADSFFANTRIQLVYQFKSAPMGPDSYPPEKGEPQELTLAYELAGAGHALDARTGQAVDWNGEPIGATEAALATIAGHWAESELRYLLQRRVLRAPTLQPGGPVTRSQALDMVLAREMGGYYADGGPRVQLPYDDLQPGTVPHQLAVAAFRQGWLQPVEGEQQFRPDAPVTRAQFVVWMARALQLGDLARSDLQVASPYMDAAGLEAEAAKAAAFLRALGLLKPSEAFRGTDPLTQAEGAALTVRVYNYLITRQR